MQPMINPPKVRLYHNRPFTLEDLEGLPNSTLKIMHNEAWDYCVHEEIELGDIKRRRVWKDRAEAVECTWRILGFMNGEMDMADKETKAEKPTPKCYSAELVKRPTRKMFKRIKKVGEPDKSQRPFAWPQFKDGMRLIDIKESETLHAGKISFWMRQEPPLIELEDIDEATFEKELDAWYKKHGLTNPEAAKKAKAEERAKAKAEREAAAAKKKEEREAAKKAKAEAAAKKKAEADAKKKAAADAKAKKAPATKKQATTA